jgi:polar amino acid transport system substrate-binding protein
MIRKLFMGFCLLAIGVGVSAQVVTIAEFVHPPLAYLSKDTNQPAGAEVAYLTAVLKEMGYTAKFVFVPFPRVVQSLQDGDQDIGALLTRTPEREAFIAFSEQPVLEMVPVLVVKKDSPLQQITQSSDVASLSVGFGLGQTIPSFFEKKDTSKFDVISGNDTTATNLKKLMSGHIDADLELNPYSAQLAIKTLDIADSLRILKIPTHGTAFYLTISKKSKIADQLLSRYTKLAATKKIDIKPFLDTETK